MLLLSLSRGSRREQDIEMDVYAQFEAALKVMKIGWQSYLSVSLQQPSWDKDK